MRIDTAPRTHSAIRAVRGFGRHCSVLLGGRVGIVVLLISLTTSVTYWRTGIFITDTYALGNAFVALADGGLAIETATYGETLVTPGTYGSDGAVYARNYGQLVTALPFLWILQAVTALVPLSVAVAAGWSLLLLALGDQVGALLDRRSTARRVLVPVAVLLFVGNAVFATPLPAAIVPLAALDLQTMVAAALASVCCYRLVAHVGDASSGAFAGLTTALASPVGFWAPFPKRHVFGALALVVVVYAFARSREPRTGDGVDPRWFRALAYAVVGLYAWVHAAEALLAFVALATVDLPTAPSNDRQTLAGLALVFGLSVLPFLVTNTLISGSPFLAPRMLDPLSEVPAHLDGGGVEGGSGSTTGSGSSARGGGNLFGPRVSAVLAPVEILVSRIATGARIAVIAPKRVIATFVKSGVSPQTGSELAQAVNLTVLEVTPLLGGLVGGLLGSLVAILKRTRARLTEPRLQEKTALRTRFDRVRSDSRRATDALVAILLVSFWLFYQPSLPVHAQITVRYLVPLVPLALYATTRFEAVSRPIRSKQSLVYRTWAYGLAAGVMLVADVAVLAGLVRADAMQFQAWLSLAIAGALAIAVGLGRSDDSDRAVAICLGLAAASATTFLLLAGLDYYDYAGEYVLGLVRVVTDAIRLV